MAAVNGERGGLKVIIVGAGIGGLSTAAFLRQQGHTVDIYESSRFATELGAAIHIPPNAHSLLKRIGVDPATIGANPCTRITGYTSSGHKIHSADATLGAKLWKDPWLLGYRVKLHNKLKEVALASGASLHLSQSVVGVNKSSGTVSFEDGTNVSGDVIIGADGVHSVCRRQLSPGHQPFGSGKSAFRFMIPRQDVLSDPQTRPYAETDGELVMIYHSDRRMVMYPTSDNSILNFVCIHPEVETASTATGNWNNNATKSMLLEAYKDFSGDFKAILSKSNEDSLKIWKLLDMPVIDSWSDGKVVLMGDAAHPFLPHQGQGGAVAIEDAAALGVLLERGLRPAEVEERLKLYTTIRKPRADRLQEYTRIAGEDLKPGQASKLNIQEYTNYNFGHDEFDNASQRLREWKWSQQGPSYWRMPTAFGPVPGPRQDHFGRPRNGTGSRFVTATINIKTSRTILQNLLPPGKSRDFASPGTVATCSFTQTTLSNLDWLGGGGYNLLGLYIHGVTCPGSAAKGTYLPVLFEDLTDPIISGREELGMPKVYSDINVARSDDSCTIKTSWRGQPWGTFEISGLEATPINNGLAPNGDTPSSLDEGLLFERYVPAVGKKSKGQAASEHAVLSRFDQATTKPRVEKSWTGKQATISFTPGTWETLPTLHHIIGRLAEIPVFEVLGSKIEEGTGVDDVAAAAQV